MSGLKKFFGYFAFIPDLLRIALAIRKAVVEGETRAKVKDDLKVIEEAFNEKDAQKLNDLFNSK